MEVCDSAHKSRGTPGLVFLLPLLLSAAFLFLFFDTWTTLFTRWIRWDEGLSHGLLIVAAFGFFFYRTLPWEISSDRTAIRFSLYAALLITSLCWALAAHLNILILAQLALIPLLFFFYAALYGIKTAFHHRMLFLLLIFAIPVWDQLNDVLITLSSNVVGETVKLIRMPALIEGNSIFIPYGHIIIADGCSGLRYLVIALAMGFIISYLNHYGTRQILIALAIAAVIGLIANWLRIFILILVGYQSQMQSGLIADHEYFGWALFGLLCLPAIYFAPVVRHQNERRGTSGFPTGKAIIPALTLLAAGPILQWVFITTPASVEWQPRLAIPAGTHDISMPVGIHSAPNGFHETLMLVHEKTPVYIRVDQYQRFDKTDKLVPYLPRLFDNHHWQILNQTAIQNMPGLLTRFREKSGTREVIQLQWLEVGNYRTHSVSHAKLLQIPAAFSHAQFFSIVTLQIPCDRQECENAIAVFSNLISELALLKDN